VRTARVLVVGGGISGLTAAAALGRCGMQVDLVEIRPKLGDLGGVGLSIMGNATKALATIDAAQACVDAGMPADTFTARTPNGKVVATPEWPPPGLSSRRRALGSTPRIGSPLLSGKLLPAEEPLHAPEQTLASLLQQCLRQDGHARHTVNGEST